VIIEALARAGLARLPKRSKPRTGAMIAADRYESIGELLSDALVQFKSETSHIEVDRKREQKRLSYLDFAREARPLIRALADRGVGPGDRVAIAMSNQWRWHAAAYAAFHRGAVLVPIDYKLTAPEQATLLAHAKPKALFIDHSLAIRFATPPAIPIVVVGDVPPNAKLGNGVSFDDFVANASSGKLPSIERRSRADVACVVYSSGTGGAPKGCLLTHDNYLEQYTGLREIFPLTAGDRYFSILPTNHAIDFMCGFVGPLCGGATIVHQRTLRPEFIRATMREYEVTHMAVVPLILEAFERTMNDKLDEQTNAKRGLVEALSALNERLTEREPVPELSRRLLAPVHDAFGGALEYIFCGGAWVDPQRAEFFYRLGIPVVIGYGLTEACTVATVNDLKPFRSDTVGKPVRGVEVRIDAPNREGVGEVLVRGRTVMKGYLDDAEATEAAFTDGWLRTGDLGAIDAAGHLRLFGRCKNMIVTAGGKNVYPEDVEAAFEGLAAKEIAVMASGYVWGGALDREFLLAVARVEAGDRDDFLKSFRSRNEKLAEHKRVHGVLFVDEEFPRTASMKVKRGELATSLRALDPQTVIPS
jgi:long-chain acyl-CoA synthetase